MNLLATVILPVVTQLASAHSTNHNKHSGDSIPGVDENLIRKSSDSVLTQVLLTMSRMQYDVSSLAKSVRDQQEMLNEIKTSQTKTNEDLTEIKANQLTKLQSDVASIKNAVSKATVLGKKVGPADFTYVAAVNGCYKVVLDKLEWSVAALRCRSINKDAHLFFINSAKEQSYIVQLLSHYRPNNYWTGGQRIDPNRESTFVWKATPTDVPGSMLEMTYTNWYKPTREPNYAQHAESCLDLLHSWNCAWNDQICTAHRSPICELDL